MQAPIQTDAEVDPLLYVRGIAGHCYIACNQTHRAPPSRGLIISNHEPPEVQMIDYWSWYRLPSNAHTYAGQLHAYVRVHALYTTLTFSLPPSPRGAGEVYINSTIYVVTYTTAVEYGNLCTHSPRRNLLHALSYTQSPIFLPRYMDAVPHHSCVCMLVCCFKCRV